MTAGHTCALPGCSKPPSPSSPGRATPHLACSNLHHQLLMAGRFNPAVPNPHHHILCRNKVGLCALPSCPSPCLLGHSWCSPDHHIQWLSDFTSRLLPEQICKLPGCTRHVFVKEDSSPSEFCGWRHCQKYVMLSARQCQQQPPPQQQSLPSPPSSTEALQVKCGSVPPVVSLVASLRMYTNSGKLLKNDVKVDDDFFNKHPWEVCAAEGQTCLLIARCKYTSKGKRVMMTKDDYHWKQQGPSVTKSSHSVKYFYYRKLKGKQDDGDECAYRMEEYTVEDVKDHSLIKLCKSGDGGRGGRHQKGQPSAAHGKRSPAKVHNGCSSNTIIPQNDDVSADSSIWNVSPLPCSLPCYPYDSHQVLILDTEDN